MTTDAFAPKAARDVPSRRADHQSGAGLLRSVVIAAGIGWSLLFVVVGLAYQLQMYGDGSIFSYAVAVRDAWGIHWHNISVRLFVYLFSIAPAEAYVKLADDARGGIVVYGLLHFGAQLLGLAVTFAADHSRGRVIFGYACFSTACLCPLVFGAPTEMWMAHALFWPALAACHTPRAGISGIAVMLALLLALVFTHEGALVLAATILITVWARHGFGAAFARVAVCFLLVASIWLIVKTTLRPDAYIAGVLYAAELNFFDPRLLLGNVTLLLAGALIGYGAVLAVLRRLAPHAAEIGAMFVIAVLLAVYWLWFDQSLHTQERYFLRTVLMLGTLALGTLAAVHAISVDGETVRPFPNLSVWVNAAARGNVARAVAGALPLIMLVHGVETAKFVRVWTDYKTAVRALATGAASDPALGDPHFVASTRIDADANRASWSSTTPFLSVLVAPDMAPTRLVVDPAANYFWLSCAEAAAIEQADSAVPVASRRLIRVLECLHRAQG